MRRLSFWGLELPSICIGVRSRLRDEREKKFRVIRRSGPLTDIDSKRKNA